MRVQTITMTMDALNADGIAESQSPTVAGSLDLDGALVDTVSGIAEMDVARKVAIASDGDDNAVMFTITGTDRYGDEISETIMGPDNDTVYSSYDYLSVSEIEHNDSITGALTVGTCSGASSRPLWLDPWQAPFEASVAVKAPVASNTDFTVQYTLDDPAAVTPGALERNGAWIDLFDADTTATTAQAGSLSHPVGGPIVARAVRLVVEPEFAGAAGADLGGPLKMTVSQSGGGS